MHIKPRTIKDIPWVKFNLKQKCEKCGKPSKNGRGHYLYNDIKAGKKVCLYCAKEAGM